jgi:hypothetical protein
VSLTSFSLARLLADKSALVRRLTLAVALEPPVQLVRATKPVLTERK